MIVSDKVSKSGTKFTVTFKDGHKEEMDVYGINNLIARLEMALVEKKRLKSIGRLPNLFGGVIPEHEMSKEDFDSLIDNSIETIETSLAQLKSKRGF